MPVIYKITNPSGKVYIGQSWNFTARLYFYKSLNCKGQPALYNSLMKYGYENHTIDILCKLPDDIDQLTLDEKEVYYWKLYKECGIETLNCREPGRGGKRTKESIRKTAEKLKGRKLSDEHKNKIIKINRSEEQRILRSKKLKGHIVSKETREKISDIIKEKWKNGEYKNRKERNDKKEKVKIDRYCINCKKIKTVNIFSGEIKIYNNYKDCAKELEFKPATILSYINKNTISKNLRFFYNEI